MSEAPYQVEKISLIAAGPDVQVREFNVAPGEVIPWHYHTALTDWCYCLEGVVAAEIQEADGSLKRLMLKPGESCRIEPGQVHRLMNGGEGPCRYLLVQAGGKYDFNKVTE